MTTTQGMVKMSFNVKGEWIPPKDEDTRVINYVTDDFNTNPVPPKSELKSQSKFPETSEEAKHVIALVAAVLTGIVVILFAVFMIAGGIKLITWVVGL